jgi:hypothetical protein
MHISVPKKVVECYISSLSTLAATTLYQSDRLANMENTVLRVEVALNET